MAKPEDYTVTISQGVGTWNADIRRLNEVVKSFICWREQRARRLARQWIADAVASENSKKVYSGADV